MPMQVYAAGFDSSSRRPRVGLLLAGVGLNQADSEAAIRALPRGVTLAISPYARNPAKLLAAARAAEHEYLLSIPMEPQGFPLNDPGKQALMTSLSLEQNRSRLDWMLSRIAGYVGAVGAEGSLRGERFASLPEEINPVLAELARRGLLYVDPRPDAAPLPLVWSRSVDLVIDEPGAAADIDDKLAQLARLAREKGSALGFAGTVRPVTTQRLAAWATGLAADGLVLAPVSALVQGAGGTMTALPYRPNVGAVLFNRDGRVFVARRADMPNAEGPAGGWQLPQGGIDPDEDPRAAVLRELAEEIGTDRAEIIGEHPEWLTYDLPPELVGVALGGRYRGQTQRWFALRFTGEDSDIRLDADPDPEFDAWRWAELAELPALAVDFKRPIYRVLAVSFARFATP